MIRVKYLRGVAMFSFVMMHKTSHWTLVRLEENK